MKLQSMKRVPKIEPLCQEEVSMSGGTAPLIPNYFSRWSRVANFDSPVVSSVVQLLYSPTERVAICKLQC